MDSEKNTKALSFEFRTAELDDVPQLTQLGMASYGPFQKVLAPENWPQMERFISTEQSYIDLLAISKCFVCQSGKQIIGMAFWVPRGNPTAIFQEDWSYIRMVGVHPDFRGNSLGKKLTQMCIDAAIENKEETLVLHTSEFMAAARKIYEDMGFIQVKELPRIFNKKYWLYQMDL